MRITTLLTLSLRNLLRQKRRNFFLGLGIMIGVAIMVVAGAFSAGLRQLLLDRWITYMNGHIQISVIGGNNDFYGRGQGFFRDRSVVDNALFHFTNEIKMSYNNTGAFVNLVGNRRSDLAQLIGIDIDEGFINFLHVIEGSGWNLTNTNTYENPIALAKDKADYLRIKLYDTVKASFQTIHGQMQTARFTVVAIYKPEVSFMGWVGYVPTAAMRKLLDFRPYEIGSAFIVLKNSKQAIDIAQRMQPMLKPPLMIVKATSRKKPLLIAGFWRNERLFTRLSNTISILTPLTNYDQRRNGVLISSHLTKQLGAQTGDTIEFSYRSRFEGEQTARVTISGVYTSTNLPENLLLLNEKTFFTIFRTLPSRDAMITNIHSPFDELFTTEWYLLPRPKTSLELSKIYEDLKRNPIYADKILITTLYESASSLLQFFSAINFSSMFFSSFLFLIVMVGLANSLRMNIRERTREIGTLRAIGMQQKDVRRLFLGEVTLLMIFSGCAGVALGILLVAFLSLIPFSSEGLIGMLLVNNHLLLIIDWGWNFFCVIFVLVLGLITAYLPSRRASRMSPSEALVHYE